MRSLIRGEPVTVLRPRVTLGEHMDVVREWDAEEVAGVLVQPGSTAGAEEQGRPDATAARVTLHFPKGYGTSLRGCRVRVRGEVYRVVGDPVPYEAANCPGPWWYEAEAARVDG